MSFQISALPYAPFAPLFAADHAALAAARARILTAEAGVGMPCRVSLTDATPGERVLLVHHLHHDTDTPFRASHALYVREGAEAATPTAGEVPEQLRRRLLSARAFDADGMMIAADVAEGAVIEPVIDRLFAMPQTAFIHLHFARQGCYAARVDRG